MTVHEQDQANLGAFRALHQERRRPTDPELELAAIRLAHGHDIAWWIALRVAAHQTGRRRPNPSKPLAARVAETALDQHATGAARTLTSPAAIHLISGRIMVNSYMPGWMHTRLLDANDPLARRHGASDPRIPATLRAELAGDPDRAVRASLAGCVHTPAEALERLARDADGLVRYAATRHPRAPRALLEHFMRDPDPATASAAVANLAARPDPKRTDRSPIRHAYAVHASLDTEWMARYANDRVHAVRAALGTNIALPAVLQQQLAQDPEPIVRLSIARRVHADPTALAILANDPNLRTRERVAHHGDSPTEVRAALANDPEPVVAETATRVRHAIQTWAA